MSGRRAPLLLLIAAALLLAPSLIVGNLFSHSSPQNLTWAEQFADQFRAGVLYPRWLPDSFDALGGPAFYFYPPFAFWVDALVRIVTFDALPVSYRLSVSSLVLLWASGLAMHVWLKAEGTVSRVALYGAVAYMAAPYHLLDHYHRGAYAEFSAFAVLPLVMLAVRQISENKHFGILLLTVGYAALPMAHLPTALLVSVTALPLYVLYRGWRLGDVRPALGFFIRCGLGGALGLCLAAIYLVPALTLQDWIPADAFWAESYRIENWFLLTPERWPRPIGMMLIIASFAAGYAIAAVGVVVVIAQGGVSQGWRSEAAFWAVTSLLCLLLIAGVIPWFWQLPSLAKVQFSWRLMTVVEFAGISALCFMPWPVRSRAATCVFMAAIVVTVPGITNMALGVRERVQVTLANADSPADLKQFLPAGYPQKTKGDYFELSLGPLDDQPAIACMPAARACQITRESFDTLRIDIDADTPTTVVLRRFFYPIWRLDPPLPVIATEPLRLVSFTASAGRNTYRLERLMVRAEKVGWVVSGAALLVLIGLAWFGRRRS